MDDPIRIGVVGELNHGKTSLIATLRCVCRPDTIHSRSDGAPEFLRPCELKGIVDGSSDEVVAVIRDTGGFREVDELQRELKLGAKSRWADVTDFLAAEPHGRWTREREIVRTIDWAEVLLYVIDAARADDFIEDCGDGLTLLRVSGKPVQAIVNLTGRRFDGQADSIRNFLREHGVPNLRRLDLHRPRSTEQVYASIGSLIDGRDVPLAALQDWVSQRREHCLAVSSELIASLLVNLISLQPWGPRKGAARPLATVQDGIKDTVDALLRVHGHALDTEEEHAPTAGDEKAQNDRWRRSVQWHEWKADFLSTLVQSVSLTEKDFEQVLDTWDMLRRRPLSWVGRTRNRLHEASLRRIGQLLCKLAAELSERGHAQDPRELAVPSMQPPAEASSSPWETIHSALTRCGVRRHDTDPGWAVLQRLDTPTGALPALLRERITVAAEPMGD